MLSTIKQSRQYKGIIVRGYGKVTILLFVDVTFIICLCRLQFRNIPQMSEFIHCMRLISHHMAYSHIQIEYSYWDI